MEKLRHSFSFIQMCAFRYVLCVILCIKPYQNIYDEESFPSFLAYPDVCRNMQNNYFDCIFYAAAYILFCMSFLLMTMMIKYNWKSAHLSFFLFFHLFSLDVSFLYTFLTVTLKTECQLNVSQQQPWFVISSRLM